MSDVNWRDKDDLDLTSEDIDSMIAEGVEVQVRDPNLPQGARLVVKAPTLSGSTMSRPEVRRPAGRLVGVAPARAH